MQYLLKLKSNPSNFTNRVVFKPLYKKLCLKKERVIPPFGISYGPEVAKLDVDLEDIARQEISYSPPWTLNSPSFMYDLVTDKKACTNPIVFKSKYMEIKNTYYKL